MKSRESIRKEIMDAIESETELYNSEYDAIAEKIDAVINRLFIKTPKSNRK